ncbi:hypothetical protein C2G38_2037295 [Gigaspora rosea]|uniref:Uncharacterized protein n=1 Tax=Gigaspora rosea TaxID=44941 RepID=A0A397VD67_9GLOM|nr:hypothetical protein C2G38_2037295 [Gigaspora rosea]
MDKESTNIPKNSFKIDKYTSVETGNVKLRISIIDEETYLENKDIPEEISFPSEDVNIKQRYRLTGVSFCDDKHYIANIRFENVKNTGWYQYDGLKSLREILEHYFNFAEDKNRQTDVKKFY